MKIRAKKYSDAGRLTSLVILVIFCLFFTNIALGFESVLGISQSVISFYLKGIIGCGFLFCLPIFFRRISHKQVLTLCIIFVLFCVQILFFPEVNSAFYEVASYFVTNCLSIAITISLLKQEEIFLLKSKMIYCSYVIAIFVFIIMIFPLIGINFNFQLESYSMGLGYACLLPCLVLLYNVIQEKSFISLCFFITILLFIIIYGSRGPLLGIILFFMYCIFIKIKKNKKNIFLFLVIIIIYAIIYMNYRYIFTEISDFFYKELGIQSRTLTLFLNENIASDSGRDILYQKTWESILQHPFLIRGIAADRILLGTYPHNMILELLYQGGVIIASISIFLLIIFTIITFKNVNNERDMICIIFFFASIPGLMISGSFWNNYSFWIWIALCLNKLSNFLALNSKRKIRHV